MMWNSTVTAVFAAIKSEHALYLGAACVALLVVTLIAYLMRDRLTFFRLKHGKTSAELRGEQQLPGVIGEDLDSNKGSIALEDQSGMGVRGKKLRAEKDIRLTNLPPPK